MIDADERRDAWTRRSSHHLRYYVMKRQALGHVYTDPETAARRRKPHVPSAETAEIVQHLTHFREVWAQVMFEIADAKNEVDPKKQRECWDECMQRAEVEIAKVKERYAQRRAAA